ncbi:hypothetical protein N9Z90_00855 [Synechococcus sp. AH-707-D15]|nr:hypothetical protein [Synechococcus sp. AH-707-D15]
MTCNLNTDFPILDARVSDCLCRADTQTLVIEGQTFYECTKSLVDLLIAFSTSSR